MPKKPAHSQPPEESRPVRLTQEDNALVEVNLIVFNPPDFGQRY